MKEQKILVTGGTGLVGSHIVVELLQKGGCEIHCIVRSEASAQKLERVCQFFGVDFGRVYLHTIMLDSTKELQSLLVDTQPDIMYHCAATVSLDGSDSQLMIRGNVDLAESVTDALYNFNMGRENKIILVHVSSIAAIGKAKQQGGVIDESCEIDHIHNLEAYSLSKFLSENVIWKGHRMGTPTVVVNPSVVLGISGSRSGDDGLQSAINIMRRGIPFYTTGVMGFVDVRDVASAMIALGDKMLRGEFEGIDGQRFVLSGENVNYRRLITTFAEQFNVRKPWLCAPKWLLRFGIGVVVLWCRMLRKRSKLTPSMVGFMTSQSRYSSEKLLGVIPEFRYHSLEQSVEMMTKRIEKNK